MPRTPLTSPTASAVGPYSHGVDAGRYVFCSGQTPIDPATGELHTGGVDAQTHQCFDHLFGVLAEAGLGPDDVDARWLPYFSDDPALVAARFAEAADAPNGVALEADAAGTIRATGVADAAWVTEAERLLPFVPGARALDASGLTTPFEVAARALERRVVRFAGLTDALADTAAVAALRSEVRALAAAAPPGAALEVLGHTDDVGTEAANRALGYRRALAVVRALGPAAGDLPVRLVTRGADDRLADGPSPASRRVTFRVDRPAAAQPAAP